MESLKEMFVTLPNWTSQSLFPTNTTGDFYVKLPKQIDLYGEWKVALTSFNIQKNWYNIVEGNNYVDIYSIDNPQGIVCKIEEGCYDNIHTLVNSLNTSIKKYFGNNVAFGYDTLKKKTHVETEIELVSIKIPTGLCEILGFSSEQDITFSQYAINCVNIDGDKEYIFVLCDIGEEQMVGRFKQPLLTTIYTGGIKHGTQLYKSDDIVYVSVKNKQFEVIHVWIVDTKGNVVNFIPSKFTFNLHIVR